MNIPQDINLSKQKKHLRFEKSVAEEFGFADFGKAIIYPFKFRTSLIYCATIFLFLMLGQSVLAFGTSTYFAALVCFVPANALVFVCLINTIKNFSQGRTNSDFIPNFNEFALWDDVIHPFLLSLAVYFISFGMLIVLIVGAVWYASGAESKIEADKQKIISVVLPNSQTEVGKNTVVVKQDFFQTAGTIMRLSLVFSVPIFLALLWGIFYFPVACAIAGFTGSFAAILNPSVGFDTVKRLGWDYLKIILMFLILVALTLALNAILQTIFLPFDLPLPGNLPAKAIVSFFGFYLSIVFFVFIGMTLFKNSARLNFRRY